MRLHRIRPALPLIRSLIDLIERPPVLNSVLDEHSAILNFENHLLPEMHESTKSLYEKNLSKFREATNPIIELRIKLKKRLSPGQLSLKESKFILDDQCNLVAVLGMGGMGKTTLASKLAQEICSQFDYIFP
jgi:adenylate kinase family enzyme